MERKAGDMMGVSRVQDGTTEGRAGERKGRLEIGKSRRREVKQANFAGFCQRCHKS